MTTQIKNKTENQKFYNKWWFWIITAIVLLAIAGAFVGTECDCSTYQESAQVYCEIANEMVNYSNTQTNYINEFANPLGENIETIDYLNC